MAITSNILLISLLIFIHPTSPTSTPDNIIQQACKATRHQKLCESSLTPPHPNSNAKQILQSALTISYKTLRQAEPMVQSLLNASAGNPNKITAVKNCVEHLESSAYRLNSTLDALPRGDIKNARAWTSSALTYQYDCWSAMKDVNDTKPINSNNNNNNNNTNNNNNNFNQTVSLLDTLVRYISNAVSLITAYDVFGDKTASWKAVKTEREGFWEGGGKSGGGGDVELVIPPWLNRIDITVCKGGTCEYETVQRAVDGSPDWSKGWRFVIFVYKGVYEETVRVGIEKKNLVISGEGMGKTVIIGSLTVAKSGLSTYDTATFGVLGDGFMARGLTIKNTAGPDAHQAVAFRSDSDQSIIEECEFIGNQSTLYVRSGRQYYNSCRIHGNVDFIFGNSASIFQDSTILVHPRQVTPEKGEDNAVTAHGRIEPAQPTGFVFRNCSINGTEEYMKLYNSNPKVHKNFLGRPWKEFSRTVFIGSNLGALIAPQGWMPSKDDFALKTLYYGEFNNSGKGSNLTGRVNWSNPIPAEHVNVYSIQNFLQGDKWKYNVTELPSKPS